MYRLPNLPDQTPAYGLDTAEMAVVLFYLAKTGITASFISDNQVFPSANVEHWAHVSLDLFLPADVRAITLLSTNARGVSYSDTVAIHHLQRCLCSGFRGPPAAALYHTGHNSFGFTFPPHLRQALLTPDWFLNLCPPPWQHLFSTAGFALAL